MFCKECGAEIEDDVKFCPECGTPISKAVKEKKFCSECGTEMGNLDKFCPECGTATNRVPQVVNNNVVVKSNKNPILAAILSFFIIGLGQIYLGLTKKGIILFIVAIVSGILMLIIIGWIIWLLVWVYAIYDAYNSAQKIQRGIVVEDTLDFNNLF